MTPIRILVAGGLVAAATGCTSLPQGNMFRPLSERAPIPMAKEEAEPVGPVDIFHHETESPVARLSRYFPALSRTDRFTQQASTTHTSMRSPGRNPSLEAVPRPQPNYNSDTATAAAPRALDAAPTGRRRDIEPNPGSDETTASYAARRSEAASIPVLPVAVLAETDPADTPSSSPATKPYVLPPLTPQEEALRSARIAEATRGLSHRAPRRRAVSTNPKPANAPISESPATEVATSEQPRKPAFTAPREDRETRQVQAKEEEAPTTPPATAATPTTPRETDATVATTPPTTAATEPAPKQLALADETPREQEPATAAIRNLDPPTDSRDPKPVAEPKSIEETIALDDAAEHAKQPRATTPQDDAPPAIANSQPSAQPNRGDAPPALDTPQASARPAAEAVQPFPHRMIPGQASAAPTAPPTSPRRHRILSFLPKRSDRIDDMPPVEFPSTYYQNNPPRTPAMVATATPTPTPTATAPKRDNDAVTTRWNWTPKLFKRFRADDAGAPPPPLVPQAK